MGDVEGAGAEGGGAGGGGAAGGGAGRGAADVAVVDSQLTAPCSTKVARDHLYCKPMCLCIWPMCINPFVYDLCTTTHVSTSSAHILQNVCCAYGRLYYKQIHVSVHMAHHVDRPMCCDPYTNHALLY